MLVSMTGFGKAEKTYEARKILVEVRSLNGKQLDLSVKLPFAYRELEMELRALLTQKLGRGKVDLTVYTEEAVDTPATPINEDVFMAYYAQLQHIIETRCAALKGQPLVDALLRLPDVLKATKFEVDENEVSVLKTAVNEAVDQLIDFRRREGAALETDLLQRVELIAGYLKKVEPFERKRITTLRQRLSDAQKGLSNDLKVDPERFEQEIIYYLEKLDITEEKVRLQNHCTYFVETAKQPEPAGRKLGFIAQEMGREINTLGAKAGDVDIQKLVVMMKDELEKIKEQVLNVL